MNKRNHYPTPISAWFSVAIVAIIALACITTSAHASRRVTLADAKLPPTHLTLMAPHTRSAMGARQCGAHVVNGSTGDRYYSDTQAYTWWGGAVGSQQWNRDHTVTYWRTGKRGRVTFDGVVFRNHSNHAVLVAGWCE